MKAKQFESPGGVTDTKKGAFRGSKEAVGKPKSILFFLQVSVLGILENIEALLTSTCNYFTALVSKSIACCKKFVFFVSIFLFVVLEDKPMAIVQNIATNLFLLFTISPISCVVRSLILLFKRVDLNKDVHFNFSFLCFKQFDVNKDVSVSEHFQRNYPTLISIQASAIVIRTTTLSDTFSFLAS